MSQNIKCPECKTIIDVDEQIRKDIENEIRKKNNEEERKKLSVSLRKELMPQIKNEVENSLKLKHEKDLEKEKLKSERYEDNFKKTDKALKQTQEALAKAKKPIDQGSPEIDGEVQERVLEKYLQDKFPNDIFTPVPKGKPGADCIQEIMENNVSCGKILWESKDVETFQEKYVSKLNSDMSDNNIGFGILAVDVLPKKMKGKFEFRENKKIIICKFDETLDIVSEMVRQYAVTVTRAKKYINKNLDKSQNELWNLFNSESFIIDFRNLLKTSITDKGIIENDKTYADKSYKKRIKIWEEKKDHLIKIIRNLSQVEGTLMTPDLIKIQDGSQEEE